MSVVEAPGLPGLVMLQKATIADVDVSRMVFDRLAPSACTFVRCDFRRATLDRRLQPLFTARRRNVFRECRFDGTDLRGVDPGASRFERCTFDGADLQGWSTVTAEFVDCHWRGRLAHVRFYARPWGTHGAALENKRSANEFRGNDFRDAELVDVAFLMGVDVGAQRWPEGEDYIRLDRIHQRLTRGRTEILRWKDLDDRGEALAMLQSLSFLYMQQNDVLARRVEPTLTTPPEVQRQVWATLARML